MLRPPLPPSPYETPNETVDEFLAQVTELGDKDAPVLATLVGISGKSGRALGRRAWFLKGGRMWGAVTLGGCADSALRRAADEARASGEPRLCEVDLGSDEAFEFGMTCSGQVRVWLHPGAHRWPVWGEARARREAGEAVPLLTPASGEPTHILPGDTPPGSAAEVSPEGLREHWAPPLHLLIVGSGPVAPPLAALARTLGLRVTVADDRPDRLTGERFPGCERRAVPVGQPLDLPALSHRSACVIVSHDYGAEVPTLQEVLRGPCPYVAVVASGRRGAAVLHFLAETGTPPEALARVRVPAGLALGVSSPAGIALSILSELVAVLNGAGAQALSSNPYT